MTDDKREVHNHFSLFPKISTDAWGAIAIAAVIMSFTYCTMQRDEISAKRVMHKACIEAKLDNCSNE